jgi:beta-lactam-binding protein with PASTA domain
MSSTFAIWTMARPVPADLEDALAAAPAAREQFWALPPEQVDAWVRWVEGARIPRARRRRIAEAVRRLSARPAVAETVVATDAPVPVAPPRDSAWLWFLGLLLLVGIGALIYWFAVRDNKPDSKPGAVVVSAKSAVPQVVGIREQAAKFQLRQAKLATTVVKRNATRSRGIVVAQTPKGGASVPQGSPVTIVVSNGPAAGKLPDLVGLAAADAAKQVADLKLTPVLKQVASKEAPGTVVAQAPAAGALAKPGSKVVLSVAGSKKSVAVPDLVGKSTQEADAALKQAGLTGTVAQVPSSQPKGTIVAQNPPAGSKVASGTAVRVNVSKGQGAQTTTTTGTTTSTQPTTTATTPSSSSLPAAPPQGSGNDYRGMQLEQAVQKIAQGRQQAIVQYVSSTKPMGIVVSNGTSGSKMRLSVSGGPKPGQPKSLPDVTGEDAAQAQSDLQSAGFTVIQVPWPVSDQSTDGTVVYETPTGSGQLPRGLTIVVYVGAYSGG